MTLPEAVQLKSLHESHSNSQSCWGCGMDMEKMINEISEIEKARALVANYQL